MPQIKISTKPRKPIKWDDYFMGLAQLLSLRSKDPSTQVGACIVNKNNVIVGTGYNGLPRHLDDSCFSWDRTGKHIHDTKYPFIIHAEQNAILNAGGKELNDCRIYVTHHPCATCAKLLLQVGIREVIYSYKLLDMDEEKAADKLFTAGKIQLQQLPIHVQIYYREK